MSTDKSKCEFKFETRGIEYPVVVSLSTGENILVMVLGYVSVNDESEVMAAFSMTVTHPPMIVDWKKLNKSLFNKDSEVTRLMNDVLRQLNIR